MQDKVNIRVRYAIEFYPTLKSFESGSYILCKAITLYIKTKIYTMVKLLCFAFFIKSSNKNDLTTKKCNCGIKS